MAYTQYEDSFYISGGVELTERRSLYRYDWRTEAWVGAKEVLSSQRYGHSAVLVSDNVVQCV